MDEKAKEIWLMQKAATRKCEAAIRAALTEFVKTTGLDPYYITHSVDLPDPGDESSKGLKLVVRNVNVYCSDPKTGQRLRMDEDALGPFGGNKPKP